ncbi:MAG TPA: 50S ribosomal protein L31e [Hadesarchaea archaeon]|nr:50S ribosomal protein L31e [Hadesarchaea archaeon]
MPEERIYVIPLRGVKRAPQHLRARRASKLVREFLKRHMKSDEIKLDMKLNSEIWKRGAKHPPSKIRVRAVKQDDGSVEAFLTR